MATLENFNRIAEYCRKNAGPGSSQGLIGEDARHVISMAQVPTESYPIWVEDVLSMAGEWKKTSIYYNMGLAQHNPIEMASIDASAPETVQTIFTPSNPVWNEEMVEHRINHISQGIGQELTKA